MTYAPRTGDEATYGSTLTYDAWNRLVKVANDAGGANGAVVTRYEYDGLNRRIASTSGVELVATSGNDNFAIGFNLSGKIAVSHGATVLGEFVASRAVDVFVVGEAGGSDTLTITSGGIRIWGDMCAACPGLEVNVSRGAMGAV